jgi:hypothetical protein
MASIGRRNVAFNIPVNWLICIMVLAGALIAAFMLSPDGFHPILVFTAAVIAGAAGLITAINNLDQRVSAADKADDVAKATRVSEALELFYRWNHPGFFQCKAAGRQIRDEFKKHPSGTEQLAYLRENVERFTHFIDILNTFEGLFIAIDNNVIDDTTAKRFFRTIVIEYWHASEEVIKKIRGEQNNARLYKEFESLYKRWRD